MNKFLKRALLVVMCLAILLPSLSFAASSPTLTSIANAVISVLNYESLYDGRKMSLTVTVTLDGKTLVEGTDYVLSGIRTPSHKVGSYPMTITATGVGMYTGTATKQIVFTITKSIETSRTAKQLKYDVSSKALKSKSIALNTKLKKKNTKVVLLKAPKGFKMNTKGKITVAKGTKQGTYTLKLRVTTGKSKKTIQVKIRVRQTR